MKSRKMIPIMSAVTGVLLLTMIVLLFTIGPLKKSSEEKSLKNPENGITTESVEDGSSDVLNTEDMSEPSQTDPNGSSSGDTVDLGFTNEVDPNMTSEAETTPSETQAPTPTPEPTPSPTPEPTPTPVPETTQATETTKSSPAPTGSYDLSGMVIVIDPGHQKKANSETEAVAPWSDEKKAKVSAGTSGVSTKRPEYEVVLEIGLKMRDTLESMGATVIMTRTSNDVNISNIERAQIAVNNNADVFLRLHCDSSDSSSSKGIGVFVCSRSDFGDSQVTWGNWLGNCLSEATGSKFRGTNASTTYSGLNWATSVPSFLLEMGFMSNSEEDQLLSDADYQNKICMGCAAFCYKMKNR